MSLTIGSAGVDALANMASPQHAIGIATMKMGMDQQAGTIMQLLQQMPQAPQPAHLGQNVNLQV